MEAEQEIAKWLGGEGEKEMEVMGWMREEVIWVFLKACQYFDSGVAVGFLEEELGSRGLTGNG